MTAKQELSREMVLHTDKSSCCPCRLPQRWESALQTTGLEGWQAAFPALKHLDLICAPNQHAGRSLPCRLMSVLSTLHRSLLLAYPCCLGTLTVPTVGFVHDSEEVYPT